MRKNKAGAKPNEFSILTIDDDETMTLTLKSYFEAAGFSVDTENDPVNAVERVRNGRYDIILLDFLMRPICGDEVVRRIREFNTDVYIILLTGHKSMAPPVKTLRELEIQGYYEKSERFDQLELLIESCVKCIKQMRTIRSYRDGLTSILEHVPQLCRQQELSGFITEILDRLTSILSCTGALAYFGKGALDKEYFYGAGVYANERDEARIIYSRMAEFGQDGLLELAENSLAAPLMAENNEFLGVLALQFPAVPTDEVSHIFAVYAKQVGAVLGSLILRSRLQLQNEELKQAYTVMHQNYIETIDAMRLMVEAKDAYTRGHSDRVSFYANQIAGAMGMDEESCERLRIAGLFHDIGKVAVPDRILLKTSRLTEEEFAVIREHPIFGRKVLSAISSFRHILDIVESHHERIDGKGYPHGLIDGQISLETRIITVADAFDAMTSKRSYRNNLSVDEAIRELQRCKNKQFDPDVVDAFLSLLENAEQLNQKMMAVCPDAIIVNQL